MPKVCPSFSSLPLSLCADPHGSRLREALLVSAPSYIAPKYKLYCSAAEPILVGTLSNSAFSCGGLSACSPLPELLLSVFFVAVNVYQCGTHSQHKQTGMEIVSSRDFRSQMGEYLRKALSSEVVIKSRDFGSFKLVPPHRRRHADEQGGVLRQDR